MEAAPLVADLDADGVPEIVFVSFANALNDNTGFDGVLRILSGADCSEIVSVANVGCVTCRGDAACRDLSTRGAEGIFCPACTPAIADLDGDGLLEIVALSEQAAGGPTEGRRSIVLDHLGRFVSCSVAADQFIGPVAAVVLADLEADGTPDVMARDVAWSVDGDVAWQSPLSGIGATIAVDLDGDGILEVTTGQRAYRADGTEMWQTSNLGGASPAVADLDLDCRPEIVATSRNNQTINVLDALTGDVRASAPIPPGDCPPRPDGQGGPPTLADVDGDCVPEVGVAGCRRYSMFRYVPGPPEQLQLMWESPTDDASSRFTGSTIFDLEGDGRPEVLYNDQFALHVFDGLTGAVVALVPNSTNTLLELPVVADADGDGRAEVLVAANDYVGCCNHGVRVLVDDAAPWAPVRPLFNQHSYHVTNILDDGRLPAGEEASWSRHNTYRVQGAPLRGDGGPELTGVPADVESACVAPPPATPTATGGCGETPVVVLRETIVPQGCADRFDVTRTWTATDRCGRAATGTQVVRVVDELPPSLGAAPADARLRCDEPLPAAATLPASDACDPSPAVALAETREPGTCPQSFTLRRTWTATDRCGHASQREQVIEVADDRPPTLSAPADASFVCEAPPAPAVTASDACDGAPAVTLDERRVPGSCPHEYRVVRTWTARDACGNAATARQVVTVSDDGPPRLVGVPGDVVVECPGVPPPASVRAEDGCDPDPPVTFTETRIDGACPAEYRLVRTWSCVDSCGQAATARQIVDVVDTTPPVLESAPGRACLWPPNHWMVCFAPGDVSPRFVDACAGEVTWRFTGCASDQPEDDLGDGHTAPDCLVTEDGAVCVRAERQGTEPGGRHYGLLAVATDACGNVGEPVTIADVYVPHDQSPHEDCLKTTVVGDKRLARRP